MGQLQRLSERRGYHLPPRCSNMDMHWAGVDDVFNAVFVRGGWSGWEGSRGGGRGSGLVDGHWDGVVIGSNLK